MLRFTAVARKATVWKELDEFSRADIEDVHRSSGAERISVGESQPLMPWWILVINLFFTFTLLRAPVAWIYRLAVSLKRTVTSTSAGRGAGRVDGIKEKFGQGPGGESHSLAWFEYDVRITSMVTGREVEVPISALVRLLRIDAVRHPLLAGQFVDHPPPARPDPGNWTVVRGADDGAGEEQGEAALIKERARRSDPHRVLVLPPEFDGWLPALSKVNGWGPNIIFVVDNTVEMVLRNFPAYLPGIELAERPTDGSVPITSRVRFRAGWQHGIENFISLFNALNGSAAAGSAQTALTYSIRVLLKQPGSLRGRPGDRFAEDTLFTGHLWVIAKLRFYRKQQRFVRGGISGQQEIYKGMNVPATATRSDSVGGSVNPLRWVLGTRPTAAAAPYFDLALLDPQLSITHTETSEAGIGLAGATGGGADWIAEFEGTFTFELSAEEVKLNRLRLPIPGGFPGSEHETDSTGDLEQQPQVQITTTRVDGEPVEVKTKLLVAEDLLDRVYPPPATATHPAKPLADYTTEELYDLPRERAVEPDKKLGKAFTPSRAADAPNERRLPQNALYLPNVGPVVNTVLEALPVLGVSSLSGDEFRVLINQLEAFEQNFRDYEGTEQTVWQSDRLEFGLWANTKAELTVKPTVRKLDPMGFGPNSFRYLHGNATAGIGREVAKEYWNWKVSTPFSLLWRPLGQGRVGPSSTGVSYGEATSTRRKVRMTGAWDKAWVDLGPGFWARMEIEWDVVLRVYQDGAPRDRHRVSPSTFVGNGLVLMTDEHARERNLADALPGGQVGRPYPGRYSAVRGHLAGQAAEPEEDLNPLPLTRRLPPRLGINNSLADAGILEVPSLADWRTQFVNQLRTQHKWESPLVAMVEAELKKVTLLIPTYAALGDLLAGGWPFSVTYRTPWKVVAVSGRLSLELVNPKYGGSHDQLQVIEPKTVEGWELSAGGRKSNTRGGSAGATLSWLFPGLATHDDATGEDHFLTNFIRSAGGEGVLSYLKSNIRDTSWASRREAIIAALNLWYGVEFRLSVNVNAEVERAGRPTRTLDWLTLGMLRRYRKLGRHDFDGWTEVDSVLATVPRQIAHLDPRSALAGTSDWTDARVHNLVRNTLHTVGARLPRPLTRRPPAKVSEILRVGSWRATAGSASGPSRWLRLGDGGHPAGPPRILGEGDQDARAVPDDMELLRLRSTGDGRWRTGLKLDDPRVLAESQAMIVAGGDIAVLRDAAKTMIRQKYRRDLWPQLSYEVDTVISHSFLVGNWKSMLRGDGLPVPVLNGILRIGMDLAALQVIDDDPDTGVTFAHTIVKSFLSQSYDSAADRYWTRSLGGTGSASLAPTVNAPSLPLLPSSDSAGHPTLAPDLRQLDVLTVGLFELPRRWRRPAG